MESLPALTILLVFGFSLAGCYSQLYYNKAGYPKEKIWKPVDDSTQVGTSYTDGYAEGYRNAVEDYPYYYKDYARAEWYARHGFAFGWPYNVWGYDPFYPVYPYYGITTFSWYYWRPGYTHSNYYTPFYFGPWVCWDPWDDPYYYLSYYPHVSIFVGLGYGFRHGGFYYPGGHYKGTSKAGRYGRRTTGTNRVKSGQVTNRTSGIRDAIGNITVPRSSSGGTIRTRGATQVTKRPRSGSNSGSRARSTGRSSGSRSSSRGQSRGN